MGAQVEYRLSIHVETPKTVIEGEPFGVTYHIRNIGENVFPGGDITIRLTWPQLGGASGLTVNHPIQIGPLQQNEEFKYSIESTPLAPGYTMFSLPSPLPIYMDDRHYFPIEGGMTFLYLEDGRPLDEGMIFGAVRARSLEEIGQAREVRIALIALILVIVFQFIDWVLRYNKIL